MSNKELINTIRNVLIESRNKSYHKDLSKSTQDKRQAQFNKQAKMEDDDPNAYKPAPGDATGKTKPSKHTKKVKKMFGESEIEEGSAADKSLQKKADKSGISKSILKQVYNRGVAAWRTGHRPGTTPEQWGHARVNSFITKGKGTWGKADKDLADKVRGASEQVVKEDNVAVRTALAKAKQVDQMEKLKLQHQKEIEALQAEHERENEGLAQQKEKEVQKLREKQERARDKQSELDAIRAKRAYEEAERAAREKERQEIIIKNKKVVELLEANEKQKLDKEYKLGEQAKQEQEEYQKIIEKQIKDLEAERRKDEEKKKMRYDHNHELR